MSLRIPNYDLTIRELQIIKLLCEGLTYKEVSVKLVISETTTKTHANNIFQKFGVNDRTQAVLHAINNGYVTLNAQKSNIERALVNKTTILETLKKIHGALSVTYHAINELAKELD